MLQQQQKKMKKKKKKKKKKEEKDIIKCISSFSPKTVMDHLLYHRITLSVSPSRGGK